VLHGVADELGGEELRDCDHLRGGAGQEVPDPAPRVPYLGQVIASEVEVDALDW
jgi:hypothetical protein